MARLPRLCLAGIPQHIIQRGNNRQICFASEADFSAYAYWLEESSRKYKVSIHAWVFMTNHVHLLVTPESHDGISRMMQTLGRHYVRYFNGTVNLSFLGKSNFGFRLNHYTIPKFWTQVTSAEKIKGSGLSMLG